MKTGTIRKGWKLLYVAQSPVTTFEPQPYENVYDAEAKRFTPRVGYAREPMYATVGGITVKAGWGVEQRERPMTGKCPKSCACQGACVPKSKKKRGAH